MIERTGRPQPCCTAPRPAILLDRDGVIIRDQQYRNLSAEISFEEGAIAGLVRLSALGLPLAVVTNQSGIMLGLSTPRQVEAVHAVIAARLDRDVVRVHGWFVCPHSAQAGCECRKPRDGLARQAAAQLGLRLDQSYVIGDRRSDLELASAIGASGILVLTGQGRDHADWARVSGFPVCATLSDAAALIGQRLSALDQTNA